MKVRIHRDTNEQLCVSWEQAPGGWKRAWVQYRTGDKDWAGTGRYVTIARCVDNGNNPAQGADTPIDLPTAISDREILIHEMLKNTRGTITEIIDETEPSNVVNEKTALAFLAHEAA